MFALLFLFIFFFSELCDSNLRYDALFSLSRVKVKVSQSCPTLCNPVRCAVHGILQARILEWAAIAVSRGSSQPRDRTWVSCIGGRLFTS